MKEITIYKEEPDVKTRLEELGLTIEELQEAAQANFLAQASCTANDAPTAPGFLGWNASVRVLREFSTTKGWERQDTKNSPRLIHPDGKFSIMFATGDDATGVSILNPSTKSNKGATTRASIDSNAQEVSLFDAEMIPHVIPIRKHKGDGSLGHTTWVFLVYVRIDHSSENPRHTVRCELSLATNMNASGYINKWRERIIIPEIDISHDPIDKRTEFAPDQEIIFKRK